MCILPGNGVDMMIWLWEELVLPLIPPQHSLMPPMLPLVHPYYQWYYLPYCHWYYLPLQIMWPIISTANSMSNTCSYSLINYTYLYWRELEYRLAADGLWKLLVHCSATYANFDFNCSISVALIEITRPVNLFSRCTVSDNCYSFSFIFTPLFSFYLSICCILHMFCPAHPLFSTVQLWYLLILWF